MEYLLIDGYNIINAWKDDFNPGAEPLEDCRDRLSSMLSNYQGFNKLNIIIVFDAHMVKGSQQNIIHFDNIKIVYTKENETADNYIERFVYLLGKTHIVRVVTSDYLEQTIVLNYGGIRMSPRELRMEMEIETEFKNLLPASRTGGARTNAIGANIKPELLEKLEKMRRDK